MNGDSALAEGHVSDDAVSDQRWRRRAACQDADPDLFFPIGPAGPALAQVTEAKTICGRCPVREACLSFALRTGQDEGIWGGLTSDERRRQRASAAGRTPGRQQAPCYGPVRSVISQHQAEYAKGVT